MRVKLGDIAILINGDRGKNYPSQNDINTEGGIPFVNAGHLSLNTIDFEGMNYISEAKYESLNSGKFVSGDILYCLRGSLGKKAIVPKATFGAVASSLVIIRPDSEKVLSEYLLLALDSSSIQEQLHKANNGSS
ncbi:MAG: restriction endonuclease subunit S, partial [Firmicutes bacterium]|nr:restriction endonuclease subunit S [Bacillota bacterium]